MINSILDCTTLNNGVKMPWLGLGVYLVEDESQLIPAINYALEAGYRAIDTAAIYKNEEGVGKAIKASDIPRDQLFITTKVWNADQGYENTLKAFEESRKKLGLDYIDLYLIHWPVKGKYTDTWKALEKLYKDGYVRAIGVSNFQIHHLDDILKISEIVPVVNQVELHPLLSQKDIIEFCRKNKIQVEAWSPLMRGRLDNPVLVELGKKYNKTPAQIILRWDLQNQVVVIPKSVHKNRIIENADIFDFELSNEDIRLIDSLNQDKRFGAHPDTFNF